MKLIGIAAIAVSALVAACDSSGGGKNDREGAEKVSQNPESEKSPQPEKMPDNPEKGGQRPGDPDNDSVEETIPGDPQPENKSGNVPASRKEDPDSRPSEPSAGPEILNPKVPSVSGSDTHKPTVKNEDSGVFTDSFYPDNVPVIFNDSDAALLKMYHLTLDTDEEKSCKVFFTQIGKYDESEYRFVGSLDTNMSARPPFFIFTFRIIRQGREELIRSCFYRQMKGQNHAF